MLTTSDVWKLLYKRYPGNEYAVLQEVRDKAGHYASRSADGLIVNLWPSRGNEVIGLEVKVSRSDWVREYKNPAKAENIIKFCDRWWLVAGDESVVLKPEMEIPATWGYMVVKKNRLTIVKEAPKLTPVPMDRSFVAAMMKRATQGMVPRSSIQEEIDAATDRSIDYKVREAERKLQQVRDNYKELKDGTMMRMIEYKHGMERMIKTMDTVITELKPYATNGEVVR
jgi:soluble cytochrome b562